MENKFIEILINEYKNFEGVEAIAIGGSSAAKTSDSISDIDIYIFTTKEIPVSLRENLIKKYSSNYEAGGEYFGSGDEYYVDKAKVQLDVMYWNKDWFNNIVENIWEKHYPSNGYTTAFLYTLKNLEILFDKTEWLGNLKEKMYAQYPLELKDNIIKRNLMLLKDKPFASYYDQIQKALKRKDMVSINHRISAFLASYFDIIFALNEQLHPGEKRLIQFAKNNCKILPENFEQNIENLLYGSNEKTMQILDEIILKLKEIVLLNMEK